jgi:hypothetical protein
MQVKSDFPQSHDSLIDVSTRHAQCALKPGLAPVLHRLEGVGQRDQLSSASCPSAVSLQNMVTPMTRRLSGAYSSGIHSAG